MIQKGTLNSSSTLCAAGATGKFSVMVASWHGHRWQREGPAPEWISTAAADLIGVDARSVRYAADRGAITSKQDRDGGPLFIDQASAEAYRDAREARERRAA